MSAIGAVQGRAARDAAAAGNPVQVGGTYRSSPGSVSDGDAVDLLMDAEGRPQVDIVTLPASTNTIEVVGDVASGAAAAGNPVLIGGLAGTSIPAAVDTGDVVRPLLDVYGRLVTIPYANPENWAYGRSAKIEDTNAANVLATDSGASLYWYICTITVMNSDTTVGTVVTIEDDDGNDIHIGYAAAGGGGYVVNCVPPLKTTSADCHIHAVCGTTSAEVYAFVSAFKAP